MYHPGRPGDRATNDGHLAGALFSRVSRILTAGLSVTRERECERIKNTLRKLSLLHSDKFKAAKKKKDRYTDSEIKLMVGLATRSPQKAVVAEWYR